MLRKIQERCCYEPPPTKPKRVQEEDADEEQFNDEVTRCILRVMNVKKGLSEADRVIRFVSLFLRHAGEKGGMDLYCAWSHYADCLQIGLSCLLVKMAQQQISRKLSRPD